jgi:hypothetical protein
MGPVQRGDAALNDISPSGSAVFSGARTAGTGSPDTFRERSGQAGRTFGGTPDGRAWPTLSPTEPTRLSAQPARAAPARLNRLSPGTQPSGAGTTMSRQQERHQIRAPAPAPAPSQPSAATGATQPHTQTSPRADVISRAITAHHTTGARPGRSEPGQQRYAAHPPSPERFRCGTLRLPGNCPPICPPQQRGPRFCMRIKPLDLGAPLRNRTVDLLLTMESRVPASSQVTAIDQRERKLARAPTST